MSGKKRKDSLKEDLLYIHSFQKREEKLDGRRKNDFVLLGTAIASLIGAILAVIGYIIPYNKYPNQADHPGHSLLTNLLTYTGDYYTYLDVINNVVVGFLILIIFISILAIIGSIIPKMRYFSNAKTMTLILGLFIF